MSRRPSTRRLAVLASPRQLAAQDRLDLTPAGGEFYRSDRADPLWDGPDDFATLRREAEADNRADDLAAWRHQQWERGA